MEGIDAPKWENLALYKSSHTDEPCMTWAMVSACQCGKSPCREEYPLPVDTPDIPLTLWEDVLRAADDLSSGWINFPPVFKIVIAWGDAWNTDNARGIATRNNEKEDSS